MQFCPKIRGSSTAIFRVFVILFHQNDLFVLKILGCLETPSSHMTRMCISKYKIANELKNIFSIFNFMFNRFHFGTDLHQTNRNCVDDYMKHILFEQFWNDCLTKDLDDSRCLTKNLDDSHSPLPSFKLFTNVSV